MSVFVNKCNGEIINFSVHGEDVHSLLDLILTIWNTSEFGPTSEHYKKGVTSLDYILREHV